jgi:hypothetical protein
MRFPAPGGNAPSPETATEGVPRAIVMVDFYESPDKKKKKLLSCECGAKMYSCQFRNVNSSN